MPGEGLSTNYFIHTVNHPNAPQLTQVLYYIIMLANVDMYWRMSEELDLGNTLINSDYDALTTLQYPKADTSKGKITHHRKYKDKGSRTHDSDSKEVLYVTEEPSILDSRMEQRLRDKSIRTGPDESSEEWVVIRDRSNGHTSGLPHSSGRQDGDDWFEYKSRSRMDASGAPP